MPRWTLIEGDRAALEAALVKELFRPSADASPLEASLLQALARRGSLSLVVPTSSRNTYVASQPTPVATWP